MGSSKSSSSSTSSQTDARSVADNGAVAVGGSNNNITMTDAGLVKTGFAYLTAAEQANTDRLNLLISAGGELIKAQNQNVETLLAAKQQTDNPGILTGNQTTLLILAAAGIVLLGKMR
jgi:predicted aspartyl protease